ncbi:hypothetical protein CDAR_53021 [Caerostris darwini]|uniref:Uncharacterized protein n=1 Tax=Caerostris darwini TaxID=1538125 RepID=A0AAV4QNN2_9ARAC|nr:hypothetical protein CDAR_53021 [Caerostris darwini]
MRGGGGDGGEGDCQKVAATPLTARLSQRSVLIPPGEGAGGGGENMYRGGGVGERGVERRIEGRSSFAANDNRPHPPWRLGSGELASFSAGSVSNGGVVFSRHPSWQTIFLSLVILRQLDRTFFHQNHE